MYLDTVSLQIDLLYFHITACVPIKKTLEYAMAQSTEKSILFSPTNYYAIGGMLNSLLC